MEVRCDYFGSIVQYSIMAVFLISSLFNDHRCIHTFNDLITTSVPEERESASPVAWSPNCDYMAIAGMGGGTIITAPAMDFMN